MQLRFPDFLIAGAPRAGTTWLYHLLDRHPEVYMAKPVRPEPKFFLIDVLFEQGIEYYARTWFSQETDAKVAGEKSTNYLESRVVARRIYMHLPHVKLIFMLREPVERAFSNYCWSRMHGLEEADFATAVALEEQRQRDVPERWRYARPQAYFSRGLYAEMLRPYLDLFPREHILCLRYEDISEEPERLAERLHVFLGIHPRPEDARHLGRINAARREHLTLSPSLSASLRQRYAEPNRQLTQLLGPSFQLWEAYDATTATCP